MYHPYAKFPPGQVSSFSPTSISGGQLWQDASTQTGAVTTWASKDSTFFPFSMTGSSLISFGALNGLNVLNFNGTGTFTMQITPSAPYTSTFSFFFVSRQTGGTNGRVFTGDGNTLYGYWGGAKKQLYMEGWISGPGGYSSDTAWDLISIIRQSNGATQMFWNGSLLVSAVSSGSGFQNFYINTGGCCGGERSDAQVAEVIVYNTAASSIEREQCEGYLAWKWGMQGVLPTTHPYKLAPP